MHALVIVPTYNERDNLPTLIPNLLEHSDLDVLVVDDASPDGTGDVAEMLATAYAGRVSVLRRTHDRGLGRSYIDGMKVAAGTNAEVVCQMDADLSHDPAELPCLLAEATQADLVIGSRYVRHGRIVNWPAHRTMLSAFANRYVRAITRLPVRDCTSGFRCWRRDALMRLPLDRIRSDGYAFQIEMTWEAMRAGCRITEVPITFVERRQGASKLTGRVIVEAALLPWRLGRPT
jgi:dolichol-phosphate mannosyltransferase